MSEPFASVIIPAYNQRDVLAVTLAGFGHQKGVEGRWELIVVDDGSTDGPADVVRRFEETLPLVYVHRPHRDRGVARNAGLAKARGSIVVFCDADRVPGNRFVERHLARQANAIERTRVVVGGVWELYFFDLSPELERLSGDAASDFARIRDLARMPTYVKSVMRMFDASGETRYAMPWIAFFGGNISLPTAPCRAAGGFNEGFTGWGFEHFELGYRLHAAGAEFLYEPDARNYHIAHRRPKDAYEIGIRESLDYCLRLHPAESVRLLGDFLRGELSLQQYHNRVVGSATLSVAEDPAVYYRQLCGPRPSPFSS